MYLVVLALLVQIVISVNVISISDEDGGGVSLFQQRLNGKSIKKVLQEHQGDFDKGIFDQLLARDNDLAHLLYSDVVSLE